MKIALLSEEPQNLQRVFPEELRERLAALGELYGPVLSKATLEKHKRFTCDCEAIFSTWGMAPLSTQEIQTYFPNLRAVFYAAGTVQYFARPFLERGVEVFSAWQANAVPVAEFTFAQLCLRQRAISNQQAGAKRAIGARSTWRRGILAITDCRLVSSGLAASGRSCANG